MNRNQKSTPEELFDLNRLGSRLREKRNPDHIAGKPEYCHKENPDRELNSYLGVI